jgi:hypothetical protein
VEVAGIKIILMLRLVEIRVRHRDRGFKLILVGSDPKLETGRYQGRYERLVPTHFLHQPVAVSTCDTIFLSIARHFTGLRQHAGKFF